MAQAWRADRTHAEKPSLVPRRASRDLARHPLRGRACAAPSQPHRCGDDSRRSARAGSCRVTRNDELRKRLEARTDRSGGPDACWPWTGEHVNGGYGRFKFEGERLIAHRVALELSSGAALEGAEIARHKCDNPPCCNPAHLERGTTADNVRDCIDRGRRAPSHHALKTHCTRGHALNGRNLYRAPGGARVCRTCRRETIARFHAGAAIPMEVLARQCRRGHARTPANTYVEKSGARRCRTCHSEGMATLRHARRMEHAA